MSLLELEGLLQGHTRKVQVDATVIQEGEAKLDNARMITNLALVYLKRNLHAFPM
jgi:hypothetical protein